MIPWLQPWKKVADYYAKKLAESRALERLVIAKFGRKALRGKQ